LLPDDENILLNELAEGNENAFRILFDRYKDKVYSFAFKFTRSLTQSEEIVQEIFLKIWIDRAKMSTVEKLESWLFMVARNKSFNGLKKIAYEYSYRRNQPSESYADSVEDGLLLKQYQQIVNRAIEKLSPQQQKVYRLRRDEGLKINEIAEQLGISPNTVKVHLTNALNMLRKALDGKMDSILILILTSLFAK